MASRSSGHSENEFSRVVRLDLLAKEKIYSDELVATEKECSALAKRFGIVAVNNFTANLTVEYGRVISISGHLQAHVVQSCVSTSVDVPVAIADDFTSLYVRDHTRNLSPEEQEECELLEGDYLDLGEVAAQYLSLALPDYPRAPDVPLQVAANEEDEVYTHRPFLQALSVLKPSKNAENSDTNS